MSNFLVNYVALNKGTEVPSVFAVWAGLSAVSCALGRRVYTQFGMKRIYGNMYIILVATSGMQRKSTAINIAQKMVRELCPTPKLLPKKVTPQFLIQAMKHVELEDVTQFLKETSTSFAYIEELNTFLNKNTYEAGLGSLLIQMYDCDELVDYGTVGRGVETARDTCLGMIAGTTVEFLKAGVTEEAIGGGLTSRMVFVYCDHVERHVAWPEYNAEEMQLRETCRKQLQYISSLEGEVRWEQEAHDLFCEEYVRFRTETGTVILNDKYLSGYGSRRGDHIIKLSMLYAATEAQENGGEMRVKKTHVESAVGMLTEVERRLPTVVSLITETQEGSLLALIRNIINSHGEQGILKSKLQKLLSNRVNYKALNDVIHTLYGSGDLTEVDTTHGPVLRATNIAG